MRIAVEAYEPIKSNSGVYVTRVSVAQLVEYAESKPKIMGSFPRGSMYW